MYPAHGKGLTVRHERIVTSSYFHLSAPWHQYAERKEGKGGKKKKKCNSEKCKWVYTGRKTPEYFSVDFFLFLLSRVLSVFPSVPPNWMNTRFLRRQQDNFVWRIRERWESWDEPRISISWRFFYLFISFHHLYSAKIFSNLIFNGQFILFLSLSHLSFITHEKCATILHNAHVISICLRKCWKKKIGSIKVPKWRGKYTFAWKKKNLILQRECFINKG